MKSKNKIFSIILALTVALGGVGIPSLTLNRASAAVTTQSMVQSLKTLSVRYNELASAVFNVTDKNKITLNDYLNTDISGGDVYATIWGPDGRTVLDNEQVTANTYYLFRQPGLYSLMYKLDDANSDIFSKQYFVAVENSIEEIVLTESLSETAKTGSYVKIPACSTSNVSVNVYSPYGESVAVNDNKFTNLTNVLGTYYIEYSKDVQVGKEIGVDVTLEKQYRYVTVEFGDKYPEPETKQIETTEEEKEAKFVLYEDLESLAKDGLLYLFKEYNLLNLEIEDEDGIAHPIDTTDAKIVLKKIDSAGVTKYYHFADSEYKTDVADPVEVSTVFYQLYVEDFEGIESESDTGVEYQIIYSSEEYEIEKTITAKTKINVGAFGFECDGIFTDAIIVDGEDEAKNIYKLPECKVSIADGFNEFTYKSFLDVEGVQVEVYFTDESGNKVEFAADGDYTIQKEVNDYKINYAKLTEKASKEDFSYEMVVKYTIDYEITDGVSGTLTKSYTSALATSFNDDQEPKDLKIEDHNKLIYSNGGSIQFKLPTATATDLNNAKKATNGVKISISSTNGFISNANPGDVVVLNDGSYWLVYTFEDTAGNKNTLETFVKVRSENDYDFTGSTISVSGSVQLDDETNKYQFSLTGVNVATALVYKEGGVVESPSKQVVNNGGIKSIDVVSDKDFVVVLSGRASDADYFVSVSVSGANSVTSVKPYSYNIPKEPAVKVAAEYGKLNCKVGDRVLYLQSENFTVETENGKFVVENKNEIVINYPGNYTIINTDTGVKTEITAYESDVKDITNFLNMKQVVSSKLANEADRTIKVRAPYIEGYFGYTLNAVVTTSDGGQQNVKLGQSFVVNKTDKYVVNFTFDCLSGDKEMTTVVSSGEIIKPSIVIPSNYANLTWTGESSKVYLINASAIDKVGNTLTNLVVKVYDKFGKKIEIKTDAEGKSYFEVKDAGIYSIYYTATDADGFSATKQVSFMVIYPEVEEDNGLNGWQIAGIVVGSVVFAGLVTWLVVYVVLSKKGKEKFINKSKKAKKEKKLSDAKENNVMLYTIAQGKSDNDWLVKKNNRVIARVATKEEALAKIDADSDGQKKIKVYNKQGRLIDSIE